jgi:hypothetical protein
VYKLIQKEVPQALQKSGPGAMISAVAAWLTVNSMRSEKVQFLQLCLQSLSNVWRKKAFEVLLGDSLRALAARAQPDGKAVSQDRRCLCFQDGSPDESKVRSAPLRDKRRNAHLPSQKMRDSIAVFRESLIFSLQSDALLDQSSSQTFAERLRETARAKESFYRDDAEAMRHVELVQHNATGAGAGACARRADTHEQRLCDHRCAAGQEDAHLARRSLNAEMVTEQEAEKQKDKRVQQEQQVSKSAWRRPSPSCSADPPDSPGASPLLARGRGSACVARGPAERAAVARVGGGQEDRWSAVLPALQLLAARRGQERHPGARATHEAVPLTPHCHGAGAELVPCVPELLPPRVGRAGSAAAQERHRSAGVAGRGLGVRGV